MNTIQAKSILKELVNNVDANSKSSLDKQITKLFISSLWGNGITLKASLKGKAVSFLRGKVNQSDQDLKIFHTLSEMFEILKQTPLGLNECPLSLRVKLHKLLDNKDLLKRSVEISASPNIELNHLKEIKESVNRPAEERRKGLSVLRTQLTEPVPVSLEIFNQLFNSSSDDEMKDLLIFSEYIKKNPQFAHPQFNQLLPLILQGRKYSQQIAENFKGVGHSQIQRDEKIKEMAREMAGQVHQLKPKNKWLFCGSFGKKMASLNTIISLIKHLPASTLQGLPQPLLNLFQNQNQFLLDPNQFIDEQMHGVSEKLQAALPNEALNIQSSFVKALFTNESRQLPETIAKHLPDALVKNLESWMQQGLIGNAMEFFQDGPMRELLLALSENGNAITNPESRQTFCTEIEAFLTKMISDPVGKGLKGVENGLDNLSKNIKQLIPLNLQYLMGAELFSYPFWLNFEKQADGKYTVLVYTSGIGFQFLPKSGETNQYQWPMRITDVDQANLSEAFFQRLLLHHVEPQYNNEFQSNPDNLFEGLLKSLQGNIREGTGRKQEENLDDNELADSLLVHPSQSVKLVRFRMLYETFLNFCQPFLQGAEKELMIDSDETAQAIETGIDRLVNEAKQLGNSVDHAMITALEATQSEIREKIVKREAARQEKNSLLQSGFTLPPAVLEGINRFVSAGDLENARDTLIWAFGDEFAEPLDALISSMKSYPSTNAAANAKTGLFPTFAKDRPKGWLRTILFSVYWHLAILAIKTAICFHQSVYAGCYYLAKLGLPILIDKTLSSLPEPMQKSYLKAKTWLEETLAAIRNLILEYAFKFIFHIAVPKEKRLLIEQSTGNFRKTVVHWARFLTDTETIDLTVGDFSKKEISITPTPINAFSKGSLLSLTPDSFSPEEKSIIGYSDLLAIELQKPFLPENNEQINPLTINSNTLLSTLKNWNRTLVALRNSDRLQQNQALFFLCERIQSLPFPTLGDDPLWNGMREEEILPLLEEFNRLSLELSNLIYRSNLVSEKSYDIVQANSGRYIASMYTILAITDKLAKKVPESGLEGFQTNGYSFLEWFKSRACYIEEPAVGETFKKICAYFTPEMDIFNLPSKKELRKKAENTVTVQIPLLRRGI